MYKQNKIKLNKMTQEQLRMQMIAGIITEDQYKAKSSKLSNHITESDQITPEFLELKKQQDAIRKQQDYLIKKAEDLKIDRKLMGDYNLALNNLIQAIFKAEYDK